MEAHEGILEGIRIFPGNALLIQILRYSVVDVQQSDRILADNSADKFTERAVNIHLAGNRNAPSGEPAVDITGHKAELCLECRPALSGNGHIFPGALVRFNPV